MYTHKKPNSTANETNDAEEHEQDDVRTDVIPEVT